MRYACPSCGTETDSERVHEGFTCCGRDLTEGPSSLQGPRPGSETCRDSSDPGAREVWPQEATGTPVKLRGRKEGLTHIRRSNDLRSPTGTCLGMAYKGELLFSSLPYPGPMPDRSQALHRLAKNETEREERFSHGERHGFLSYQGPSCLAGSLSSK